MYTLINYSSTKLNNDAQNLQNVHILWVTVNRDWRLKEWLLIEFILYQYFSKHTMLVASGVRELVVAAIFTS